MIMNRIGLLLIVVLTFQQLRGQNVVEPEDILSLQYARVEQFNEDGKSLIYGVYNQRGPNEKAGPARLHHFILNLQNGEKQQLFHDSISVNTPKRSPDGQIIAFLYKKGKDKRQLWKMSAEGGNMVQLTNSKSDVTQFEWHPDGNAIAYLAQTPATERELELKKRGYDFIFFEENLKNSNLHMIELDKDYNLSSTRQLTEGMHVWDFNFDMQGDQIAYSASEKNLIDQRYMFRKIYVLDLKTKEAKIAVEDRGKLGNYEFSPDGNKLAFTSAFNIHDHVVSQAFVINLESMNTVNLTPRDFKGHMNWVHWKDNSQVVIFSEEGVYPKLSVKPAAGGERKIIMDAEESGIIFGTPVFTDGFTQIATVGSTPYDPNNIYLWKNGKPEKVVDLNTHLEGKEFGKQEVFQFNARDGQEIEGILIKPVDYKAGEKYPLISYVHGGPEAHYSNGWISRYSAPGQVMAGKGYLVAYINYRASTGYGVDFGMEGFGDPAGKEFDDIADGIDYLVKEMGADRDRVGVAGGSYGGYASAWFATYYTEYARAVCMFVGVSNLLSKKGTTDIPYEDLLVHSGKPLEKQWLLNLERSPVYWAHQSKTATLIYGGADDPRVHPSQSLELYRRMKMNNHPAVRLVQYPGEGHGNRKQVGRIDVLYRQINWFDWYVKNGKPIDGPMPPLDISDAYGLDWEF